MKPPQEFTGYEHVDLQNKVIDVMWKDLYEMTTYEEEKDDVKKKDDAKKKDD